MTSFDMEFVKAINFSFDNISYPNSTVHGTEMITFPAGFKATFLVFYIICLVATLILSQGFIRVIFVLKALLNCILLGVGLCGQFGLFLEEPSANILNATIAADHLDDIFSSSMDPDEFAPENLGDSAKITYRFVLSRAIPDFIHRTEESLTALFFYEIYQCVCSLEVRPSIGLPARVLHISLVALACLLIQALQESAKYLLNAVLQFQNWSIGLWDLMGMIQSVIILLAMIYMMVHIIKKLRKAAEFRQQQERKGGQSNFLFFLPFVLVVSHSIRLAVDALQFSESLIMMKRPYECFDDMDPRTFDENWKSCFVNQLTQAQKYVDSSYSGLVEFCYLLLHLIRRKWAEKKNQ